MTRLNNSTVGSLPEGIAVPRYNRQAVTSGIVHIGVGGFHRAHEAVYIDDLLNQGVTDWGITGIGLRPADRAMQDALGPQDCLYTVVSRSAGGDEARVIGSLLRFLFAPDNPQGVLERMAAPETRIVSLTITEGGYTTDAGDAPRSAFDTLCDALHLRRTRGLPPFTVLSCDNLPHNGDRARQVLLAAAEGREPGLRDWIAEHVAFPSSMVDRITPQTTEADRALVQAEFGIEDAWSVVTEPFRQWIIEDKFSNGRPPLERVGAQFVPDVHPYELMKIRLLNASHSAMGYLGFLAGFQYIHEIVADSLFREYIRRLMDAEVTPLLLPVPGVDLADYKRTLLTRFANPAIKDQVTRICLDGSSKVPKFVLPSVQEALAAGQPAKLLTLAVAGWLRYLTGVDEQGNAFPIDDPLAARLQATAQAGGRDPRPLLSLTDLFGDLGQSPVFVAGASQALESLYTKGARATVRDTLM